MASKARKRVNKAMREGRVITNRYVAPNVRVKRAIDRRNAAWIGFTPEGPVPIAERQEVREMDRALSGDIAAMSALLGIMALKDRR